MSHELSISHDKAATPDTGDRSAGLQAKAAEQAYTDRESYLNAFKPADCASLHPMTMYDSTHSESQGSSNNHHGLPQLWVSEAALKQADIWGKDNLVTMGELTTEMRRMGFSADDMKKLDEIEKRLEKVPAGQPNGDIVEDLNKMTDKWIKSKNPGATDEDVVLNPADSMARMYVQFKQLAALDGNANSITLTDLKINNENL
jgi:hypothetical protein